MHTIRAGLIASSQTWNAYGAPPQPSDLSWDTYAARQARYLRNESYYSNTVYESLTTAAQRHKDAARLYKFIRAIYNPAARSVNLIASYVYAGNIDMAMLTGGAIPLVADNEAMLTAVRQVFQWSRWNTTKAQYVKMGARLGDVFIKVVDDAARQSVRLELLHPSKVVDVEYDGAGNIKACAIEYEYVDRITGKVHTYREEIDKKEYRTYRDGELFAYYVDARGALVARWPNEYGFVPMVLATDEDTGAIYGVSAFAHATRKIDEINDVASLVNDQIRKTVNVIWAASGMSKPLGEEHITLNAGDERDQAPVLYMPQDATITPMIANLPIADALAALQLQLTEVKYDLPEISLAEIRSGGHLTAPGVRAGYSDAIGRIENKRARYDEALTRALQMAVTIGGIGGYRDFAGFDINSYSRGDMELSVRDRPVIGDTLSTLERLQTLQGTASLPPSFQRLVLKELDFSQDDIEAAISGVQTANAVNVNAPDAGNDALTGAVLPGNAMSELTDLFSALDLGGAP